MKYYKQEEIQEYIDDNISDYEIDDDLHHNLFNTDYYLIGYYQCEQWLGLNTFKCIQTIQDYEKDNFGEVSTDISSPGYAPSAIPSVNLRIAKSSLPDMF